jgi:hypothetical protein
MEKNVEWLVVVEAVEASLEGEEEAVEALWF